VGPKKQREGKERGPLCAGEMEVGRAKGIGPQGEEAGCEGGKEEVGCGERNQPKMEKGRRAGRAGGLGWLHLSLSFPFSISFPDFQTKIHLNSNGI
jgi:hypothetical protein